MRELVLRRMVGGRRNLHKEELHYSSPNMYIAGMDDSRIGPMIFARIPNDRDH
jgi:hypothetical protein